MGFGHGDVAFLGGFFCFIGGVNVPCMAVLKMRFEPELAKTVECQLAS